jgi:integral membrane protein
MSTLKAFGTVAAIEAISWLALLAAMVFKYGPAKDFGTNAVSIIGPIHGVLTIAYVILLYLNYQQRKWTVQKALIDFVCLFIPFASLWVARQVFEEDRSTSGVAASGAR